MIQIGQVWKDHKKDCYILIIGKEEGITEENAVMPEKYKGADGWLRCRISQVKNPSTIDKYLDYDKDTEGYDLYMDDGLVINIKYNHPVDRAYASDNKVMIGFVLRNIDEVYTLVGTVSDHVLKDFVEKENEYYKRTAPSNL